MRKCIRNALMAIVIVLIVVWVLDTMFDGAMLNFISSTVSNLFRGQWISRSLLFGYGLIVLLFIALIGIVTAYRTYMVQHGLYVQAKAEAERAKDMAQREMQRKSDLITYLAHDLKTPLASVIAYLNLLSESPDLAPDQRAKHIGITLSKAYRLEQLIEELFEIIRFNMQTITINESRFNLKFMLEQLADEFYPILLPQGKSIRVQCDEGITLRGDADKLARVFNNILKNASVYSYDNTQITTSVRNDDNSTEIRFENHGDPIPQHKLDVIFEKFYRLDEARSTRTGGAGLGLAIAKEIVEAHGGAIAVRSDVDATVFVVSIPNAK